MELLTQVKSENLEDSLEAFNQLKALTQGHFDTLRAKYPHWDASQDARLIFFRTIDESAIDSFALAFAVSPEVEKRLKGKMPVESEVELRKAMSQYYNDWKAAMFFHAFVYFELFIRVVADSLGLTEKDSISTLAKDVITRSSLNNEEEFKSLIDLTCLTRNTIHFASFHTRKDEYVNYKGNTYQFLKSEYRFLRLGIRGLFSW
ncbi:MAG: hypothetical protein IPN76_05845 [Saprospiraceae bacterium]|nr:hypothetical protein [Saprospiraceae bacterium]